MKLTIQEINLLPKLGYDQEDAEQIEKASKVTTFKFRKFHDENFEKTITEQQAEKILGRNKLFTGLARSAFHWSSVRTTQDQNFYVIIDSSKYFKGA